jgi:predicted NodU family carbamoyl transferase
LHILGVSAFYHDSAAALMDPETGEGDLVSMEKTLFSRHTFGQPIRYFESGERIKKL